MLRRALTGHHHHPLCAVHTQWLSRTTAALPSRASPGLQNPTAASPTRHQPFSTSFVCRQREGGDSEEESSQFGNDSRNPSSHVGTSGGPSSPPSLSPPPAAQAEGSGDLLIPVFPDLAGNSTNEKRVLRGYDDATQAEASPAQADRSSTRPRTRIRARALRPLLVPPSVLFPATNTPLSDPSSSSSADQDQRRSQKGNATDETGAGSGSVSTTVAVGGLPYNLVKSDIRRVFQPFGEVKRILVHRGGRNADVVFADVESVRRALHAYAEQPLRVGGREIVVFRRKLNPQSAGDVKGGGVAASHAPFYVRREPEEDGVGANDSVIFVANFPAGTTREELSEVLTPFGKYEQLVMRPGSKYAYFTYLSDDRVENILRVHERIPITFRGQSLRIERPKNRPNNLSSTEPPEEHLAKPLDPAASSALVEELKMMVPGWKGSCEPSRVLWIGRLSNNIPRQALTNFWSRLGCVVEVRPSSNGYAHVEFASTEDAIRAAFQGVPHGFRYKDRLLHVDFAPWVFYVGPLYRSLYVSGWSASDGRSALLRWASDIPNVVGATVLPPFRGEERSAPRGAFLYFTSVGDARAGLRALRGRKGPPGSETLQVTLSRKAAVHSDRLWRWAYAEERGSTVDDLCFADEWAGLGFGTGREESVSFSAPGSSGSHAEPGTRGGRRIVWKEPAWTMEMAKQDDAPEVASFSHSLWPRASGGGGGGEGGEDDRPSVLRDEAEREVEEREEAGKRALAFVRRMSRR